MIFLHKEILFDDDDFIIQSGTNKREPTKNAATCWDEHRQACGVERRMLCGDLQMRCGVFGIHVLHFGIPNKS